MDGGPHMRNAKGALEPIEMVGAMDQLEDETVRKIMGYAIALSEQIGRFKEHTFADIGSFDAILAQEYGATKGGVKGNKTLMSKNEMYLVNVAYKFTAALTGMAEYSQMTTDYLGKGDATNDRVQLAMKYAF